jgi:hypothetical protein
MNLEVLLNLTVLKFLHRYNIEISIWTLARSLSLPLSLYVYMFVYVYIYMYVYMCVYTCVYIYAYIYVCVYIYICMYVCVCVCMYVCIYIYIYIYALITLKSRAVSAFFIITICENRERLSSTLFPEVSVLCVLDELFNCPL